MFRGVQFHHADAEDVTKILMLEVDPELLLYVIGGVLHAFTVWIVPSARHGKAFAGFLKRCFGK